MKLSKISIDSGQEDDLISQINITPLVDVVLVLLIIFMVTAPIFVGMSLKINLLTPVEGVEESVDSPVSIILTEDKGIYLRGRKVSLAELSDEIIRLVRIKKDVAVAIAADRNITHGDFMQLVAYLQELGIKEFAIQVETK